MRSLERMLKLAESLGMEVIAEGIESPIDLGVLKACGVKYGQGFLWGRPASKLDDFKRFLPESAIMDLRAAGAAL
jgi:EAL domain-containing protein (putative c-di-GMP-specific phosphodiesterase class I)